MRCIVCGGDHQPRSDLCDSDGMDREIARLGGKRWNALTAHVMRVNNRETCICGVPGCHRYPPVSNGERSDG
jgi:hypothetical protein